MEKLTNTWKLHNTHLNSHWVKEKNEKVNQKKILIQKENTTKCMKYSKNNTKRESYGDKTHTLRRE